MAIAPQTQPRINTKHENGMWFLIRLHSVNSRLKETGGTIQQDCTAGRAFK